METFAEELAMSDSTVRLDAIRDDWTAVLTDHLRGGQPIVSGDLVRADDRHNLGTVRHIDHDRDVAVVHFVSPNGAQADVELELRQLEVVIPYNPLWMATTDELRGSVGDAVAPTRTRTPEDPL